MKQVLLLLLLLFLSQLFFSDKRKENKKFNNCPKDMHLVSSTTGNQNQGFLAPDPALSPLHSTSLYPGALCKPFKTTHKYQQCCCCHHQQSPPTLPNLGVSRTLSFLGFLPGWPALSLITAWTNPKSSHVSLDHSSSR